MEIDNAHFFAIINSLELFARRAAKGRAEKCNFFGITQSFTQHVGDETTEKTLLIAFKSDPIAGQYNIMELKDHSYPNGSLLYFYDDEGDMVTQAALTGDPIMNMPEELRGLTVNVEPPEENDGQL